MGFLSAIFSGKAETPEEKAAKELARKFDTLKYDGLKAMRMNQLQYALKCFEEALKLKDDDETNAFMAELYIKGGRPDLAVDVLKALAHKQPENFGVHMHYAQVLLQTGQHEEALEVCSTTLAGKIDDVEPQNVANMNLLRAHCLLRKRQVPEAVAAATQALTINDNYKDAYMFRAQVLLGSGSTLDAEADVDEMLRRFEPTEDVQLLKANICAQLRKVEDAIEMYGKVTSVNPFCEEAYLGLARALANDNRKDEALKVLTEALEQLPMSAHLYTERGRINTLLGDQASAMDDLKKALALNPEMAQQLNGQYQSK